VQTRRPDLDWLRVSAFALLILYHCGMAWSGWPWHLTSPDSLAWLREAMRFVNRWRMPLLFMVSGGAIMLALGSRTPGVFMRDRLHRLLLPLAFAMIVIVPPQVYLERHYYGQFTGSFLDWLPHMFDGGAYPKGNLSWHHLWFLAYVLIFTFALLPYFLWARSAQGRRVQDGFAQVMARFGLHWSMALPLAASILWLAPLSRNVNGVAGDWHGLAYYGVLVVYGAFLFGSPRLMATLNAQRWLALVIGVTAYATLYGVYFAGTIVLKLTPAERPLFALLSGLNTMAWLFAIVGFANRHLTTRPVFIARATEGVYAFYILHQTVTVIAVYGILQLAVAPAVGFALAVLATLLGTSVLYFGLILPLRWLHPLFGMAASRRPAPAALPASTGGL
jgi:hypothetical protein